MIILEEVTKKMNNTAYTNLMQTIKAPNVIMQLFYNFARNGVHEGTLGILSELMFLVGYLSRLSMEFRNFFLQKAYVEIVLNLLD
jgi:hypothetical protein